MKLFQKLMDGPVQRGMAAQMPPFDYPLLLLGQPVLSFSIKNKILRLHKLHALHVPCPGHVSENCENLITVRMGKLDKVCFISFIIISINYCVYLSQLELHLNNESKGTHWMMRTNLI